MNKAKRRVKKSIDKQLKEVLRSLDINAKEKVRLSTALQDLFIAQQCDHNWKDVGSFMLSISKCKKCGIEDIV